MKYNFKIVALAGIGAILEVYDFLLYVIFSAEIVDTFFSNIISNNIKAFITIAIFSITYLVRPIGAISLGLLGDRYGRKKVFTLTIILMGLASICMGLMPSYASWGLFASITFVLFRILQGFALSGELPAAYVIVYESTSKRMGLNLSILLAFVLAGFIFATTVCMLLQYLFGSYAWRVGFILGGGLAVFGYYARLKLVETPLFKQIKHRKKKPLLKLLKENALNIFTGFCFAMLFAVGTIILLQYSNFYISHLLNIKDTSSIMIPVQITVIIAVIAFGFISDRVGFTKMYLLGCVLLLITIPIVFYLMSSFTSVLLGMIFLITCYAIGASVTLFFLCDIFPTEFRLTGVALSYGLNSAFVGGLCPIISAMVMTKGKPWMGPSVAAILCLIFSLLAIFMYKKIGGYYSLRKVN